MIISTDILDALVKRKQQIYACESVAIPAAMVRQPEFFIGQTS